MGFVQLIFFSCDEAVRDRRWLGFSSIEWKIRTLQKASFVLNREPKKKKKDIEGFQSYFAKCWSVVYKAKLKLKNPIFCLETKSKLKITKIHIHDYWNWVQKKGLEIVKAYGNKIYSNKLTLNWDVALGSSCSQVHCGGGQESESFWKLELGFWRLQKERSRKNERAKIFGEVRERDWKFL